MAYNENTAQRIRQILVEKNIAFEEKKMFGGVCILINGKMCCGTHIDKQTNEDFLLCRVGEEQYISAIEKNYVIPMTFTGKPMKGYLFVTKDGHKTKKQLSYWLQLCKNYNPKAIKNKK